MKKRAWAVLFVIFCFKNGFAASETAVQEVSFELREHFIVVKGSIGTLDNQNLIVDTGASLTTLSPTSARKLDLKGEKKHVEAHGTAVTVEQVEVPSVKLGQLEFATAPGWIAKLSFPDGESQSLRIDGLIGLNLLKRTSLTIDYETRVLRFGPVGTRRGAVPFYPRLPIILVSFYVQGEHLSLLLDTAAADLILFESKTAGRIKMERGRDRKEVRGEGGKMTLQTVGLKNVLLGNRSWDTLTAYLLKGRSPRSGVDGILGPLALGCKRLHLDFANNAIVFE